jgi:hypothetical protein
MDTPLFNPRSPQQQGRTGQSKDDLARWFKMRKIRLTSKIRFLLLALVILAIPAASFAQFGVAITIAPPGLPVYVQPMCPADGYMWTPGYWSYGDDGYFWVPGTWEEAPEAGLLWTPGYWGWGDNAFAWNEGYWGTSIGFYGGVNYGFGYGGLGYQGGYWNGGAFYYNRSVNNVNVTNFHNVYSKTVINNTTFNHVTPAPPRRKRRRRTSNTGRQRHYKPNMCTPPAPTTPSWRR